MVICCLCLKESEDVTDIFGDLDDRPPNVAIVIAKHFWFEVCCRINTGAK